MSLVAALLVAPAVLAEETRTSSFKIDLPTGYTAFAKSVQTVPSPEGPIEATNWVSKAPTGEAIVVTKSLMPAKILNPDKLFAGTRDSLLKSLKATLENEEKRAGDQPSVRLLFKSDAAVFRSRLLVDGDVFYQLLYVGRTAEQRQQPAVAAVFESFAIAAPSGTIIPAGSHK
jgi:hypothetical protein